MANFDNITEKLESFIRRYYTNELIKGGILFVAIGLLYFLFTLFVEYIFWLSPSLRTLLFWVFIAVETALFVKFILFPLAQLFKFKKGIDYIEASKIIGKHFPEVNDKLLNVLQLNQSNTESELLLASIDQKSVELQPVPFQFAINFKQNRKYLKYAAIPILIIVISLVSGKFNWFSDSYKRVVDYKTAYEPPAPFQFFVVNDSLTTTENEDFTLSVRTAGTKIPENAKISYNGETYFLQQKAIGEFEFVFTRPKSSINFELSANDVRSKTYTLTVAEVPEILDFEMVLDYPNYIKKSQDILKGTGNATIPQGTKITWQLHTKATDNVTLVAKDTLNFQTDGLGKYAASKSVYANMDYAISTSNKLLKDYEKLSFSIEVIKDSYPELNIEMQMDSIDQQSLYFYGQASDDYGLSKLQLVYYPISNSDEIKKVDIPIAKSNISEFISAFPNDLQLQEGEGYELFFQVFDNDALSNFKSTKSSVYYYRKLTKDEEEQKQLEQQNETIDDLNKSLEKIEDREKELEEFSKTQKEKSELNFNDKKKLENFLQRQKQQEEMMQNFNKKLKENLEEFQRDNLEQDQFKEDLKERLEENEQQLKEDEKLLEELEKLQEKINKEELTDKLEKLAKQNKNQKRSLEQLLELTKRYYVSKKLEKLQQELDKLAEEQDKLSEEDKDKNNSESQEELNKNFDDFQEQLDELQKENKELKQPIDLPQDKKQEEAIQEDQKEATEQLEKQEEQDAQEENKEKGDNQEQSPSQNQQNAKKKQKQAAQKMKQMSEQMQMAMQMGGAEQMQEDMEMLRQILDNLVLFSFDQENLMNQFKSIEVNHNKYAGYLVKQNSLKEHFSHIDDSLFALSLRQPKISERINKEISEVFFNIDKSLDQFSENRLYQGVANQQYTLTAANNLADFLSDILNSMQMQMQGSGMGSGGQPEPGLPDIIMSQEELNKQMQEGMKKSESGKPNEGEKGKEGEDGDKEGEQGKQSQGGQEGSEGQEGNKLGQGEGSEELNGELFRIYQQQQQIRQALEDKLAKEGKTGVGNGLLRQMEEIELDLLNKGFTNQTLQKMMNLQHQLLKLENATFQQGQDTKRQSKTNQENFKNNSTNQIPKAKEYFNTTEILNRETLPLQPVYKKKVQEYFKQKDD
ncbi:hypothetical protein C1T31_01300 [Hanstruepera neustonica]|uniref:DUF4175 domain-containing protein n=1 Tax=Hanstruepera neustonica TaxID=1445657 RepID=A0A2K1E3H4_9FLAO|nr:DUF4175 family protein [Hanstruepera neustonica]PNQ74805.1 hypothetical protein C1T31_01300 [Hanstruepera neustonica]